MGLPAAGRALQRWRKPRRLTKSQRLFACAPGARQARAASGGVMPSTLAGSRAGTSARAGALPVHAAASAASRARIALRAWHCDSVSSEGVALPSTMGTRRASGPTDRDVARVIAHAVLLLERGSCSSSTTISPSAASARRRPAAYPARIARFAARGGAPPGAALARTQDRCATTRRARRAARAASTCSSCGVRLISGTSISTWSAGGNACRGSCEIDRRLAAAGHALQQGRT